MQSVLDYPFDYALIQRKKRSLKKELESASQNFVEKKVAILGGSTTIEVQNILELFLLKNGIKPTFYQSEYNKYYEDVVLENPLLDVFSPDIIYIHTTSVNITNWPEIGDSEETLEKKLKAEMQKFENIWSKAKAKYKCLIIQNNFEYSNFRELGNIDTISPFGKNQFIRKLNQEFYDSLNKETSVVLNDINYLAGLVGLNEWHSAQDF
ncbi:MAG: hypothetical protein K2Q18_06290, partial [Bdellovibrionales bacterium]|nr:hypothetical protein [Bdellovibrionales bacterium]